jgi:type II secretory pathway pseudopilin PulG
MSLDDRLSFGDSTLGGLPPETQPEPESGGGKPNRAFIFIAVAMGGLILLGILALVGALTFVLPRQRAEQAAAVTKTIEAATQVAAAWTPTFTPAPTAQLPTWTPAPPTWTPIPKATATRVVQENGPTPTSSPTPTKSVAADWGAAPPSSTTTTPAAGLGGLGTAAIAVGLTGLLFAVRRLRR